MTKTNPLSRSFLRGRFLGRIEPSDKLNWQNVPRKEYGSYARTFHNAAKVLAAHTDLDRSAGSDWDTCPVVSLYTHALELHLKALVLDGINFLSQKPDLEFVYRTHSLRRLMKIVWEIAKCAWQKNITLVGLLNLYFIRIVVEDLDVGGPGSYAFRYAVDAGGASSKETFSIDNFAKRMDEVLNLLDATAEALTAEWDLRIKLRLLKRD
jgi:hypothetical protein